MPYDQILHVLLISVYIIHTIIIELSIIIKLGVDLDNKMREQRRNKGESQKSHQAKEVPISLL